LQATVNHGIVRKSLHNAAKYRKPHIYKDQQNNYFDTHLHIRTNREKAGYKNWLIVARAKQNAMLAAILHTRPHIRTNREKDGDENWQQHR